MSLQARRVRAFFCVDPHVTSAVGPLWDLRSPWTWSGDRGARHL